MDAELNSSSPKLIELSFRLVMDESENPENIIGLAFYKDGEEIKAQILTSEQTKIIVDMCQVLLEVTDEKETV